MQHKEFMMKLKTTLTLTAAGLLLASTALAQQHNMGHDMMGGQGGGCGMEPGMMSGYGDGTGGRYGAGMGMGMGGMRGNPDGALASLKLSADQRKQIANIRSTSAKAMWQLMGTMHEQYDHMQGMRGPGGRGRSGGAQVVPDHDANAPSHVRLAARHAKKIDSVLTKEQREQLAQ